MVSVRSTFGVDLLANLDLFLCGLLRRGGRFPVRR